MISPDDVCQIDGCGLTRENHGDKLHMFSEHGELRPLPDPPPARNTPPRERDSTPSSDPVERRSLATLVEILAEKELLSSNDIIRIFQS